MRPCRSGWSQRGGEPGPVLWASGRGLAEEAATEGAQSRREGTSQGREEPLGHRSHAARGRGGQGLGTG